MHYEIYPQRRFKVGPRRLNIRVVASNGKIIFQSTQGYNNLADANDTINTLRTGAMLAEVRVLNDKGEVTQKLTAQARVR